MRLLQFSSMDGLIARKCDLVMLDAFAMPMQSSPVLTVCSGPQVGLVPEAMDGRAPAIVVEALLWAEQDGALNGVPSGALRQTFVPERRFEQSFLIIGLNEKKSGKVRPRVELAIESQVSFCLTR